MNIIKELMNGSKIRSRIWDDNYYWECLGRARCITDSHGKEVVFDLENLNNILDITDWEIYYGDIMLWYGYVKNKTEKKWFGDFSTGVDKEGIVDFNEDMRDCIMYPHNHTMIEGMDMKQGEKIVTEPMMYTIGDEVELFFKVEYCDEIIYEDKVTFVVTDTRTIKSECEHMANLMDHALTRIK